MRRAALALAATILLVTHGAAADPQWNASLVTGAAGIGRGSDYWQDTDWYNALRADVLFGRSRNADLGIGPYLSIATAGFDDSRFGGGASLQLPVHPYFPIVLSGGAYARQEDGFHPGASAWLFWGSRSYNFHSSYVMAGGLLVGFERDLDDRRQNTWVIAAQVDGLVLALPFLLGYEWLRGSPDEE
jgi:hypothetical protein